MPIYRDGVLVVAVDKEARYIGGKDVRRVKNPAVGNQVCEQDVSDDIAMGVRSVHFVQFDKGHEMQYSRVGVAEIDAQHHVGGILGAVDVCHFFIFVSIAVTTCHDVAEN